ncbi:tRNA preQ1(34) S-adenosylmethionine ribosyltransferase-isomerase QueA [Ereboglobus luteus]|uniref:S-adenosylmethionine:tRNA ribosyltransferase-isomerase n=1 Tax=Ereboglobus luteus TaxID=1796921 RepID=A0A2U8E5S4_9BACT|nr:tRNA preQ1(34) S-adenosylmethionine ribosyltransferase-isomerase QueA [Ereboglobus luteus]AWI10207.1 tRNA preQ1(34) S-adenosylmethionine ribosyltransferase-isomerase QueA [Ereboglobus luteus]
MPLSTDLFDYQLPPRLIAQTPAGRRDASRLLVVDRTARTLTHATFADLPRFLRPTDTLFRNNAAVLPARLRAQRPTGGAVECFLLRPEPARGENIWWCLLRPGKKLPVGATFAHGTEFTGHILEKNSEGGALIRFETAGNESIIAVANRLGEIPLPPYINRDAAHNSPDTRAADRERYQTVYAARDRQVAVAAPTAGLHFTPELLARLGADGVAMRDITLHVGLGTFKPIETATIEEHPIHRELYEIPASTQSALLSPRGRRVAVGTTSVRTIEDFFRKHSAGTTAPTSAFADEAALYIYPPSTFAGVDALITNFHQPRSTLLCLVAAFLSPGTSDGIAWIREIYAEAIAKEYRFFSYGDAMLIV